MCLSWRLFVFIWTEYACPPSLPILKILECLKIFRSIFFPIKTFNMIYEKLYSIRTELSSTQRKKKSFHCCLALFSLLSKLYCCVIIYEKKIPQNNYIKGCFMVSLFLLSPTFTSFLHFNAFNAKKTPYLQRARLCKSAEQQKNAHII